MKKIIHALLYVLLNVLLCYSQEQDTTKPNLLQRTNNYFKDRASDEDDLKYHGNWAGFEVGFNNYFRVWLTF